MGPSCGAHLDPIGKHAGKQAQTVPIGATVQHAPPARPARDVVVYVAERDRAAAHADD